MTTANLPNLSGMEPFLGSADGRFTVYRKYKLVGGGRVLGVVCPTPYAVYDSMLSKMTKLYALHEVDSLLHFRNTGEQLGKWFHNSMPAPKAVLNQIID